MAIKKCCSITILFSIILLALFSFSVFAETEIIIPLGNEIAMPSDFDFKINDSCSGHLYFLQSAAQSDGKFILYSHHYDPENVSDDTFKRVYIDVYDKDGTLIKELSFYTTLSLPAEIKNDCVNFYFYSWVLVYNLVTQEAHYYEIEPDAVQKTGLSKDLNQAQFTAGQWQYECRPGMDGYTALTRTNGNYSQDLVNMSGTGRLFWSHFVTAILLGSVLWIILPGTIVFFFVKMKRKK